MPEPVPSRHTCSRGRRGPWGKISEERLRRQVILWRCDAVVGDRTGSNRAGMAGKAGLGGISKDTNAREDTQLTAQEL